MGNNNLQTFDNIYADLAQSTYNGRTQNFPPKNRSDTYRQFVFSQDIIYNGATILGGRNLPHNGVVYLQPDKDLKSVTKTMTVITPQSLTRFFMLY